MPMQPTDCRVNIYMRAEIEEMGNIYGISVMMCELDKIFLLCAIVLNNLKSERSF